MAVELDSPLQDLPRATVQEDWPDVVKDVATGRSTRDKFWVSLYKEHAEPVHASVVVSSSSDNPRKPNLQGEDGIEVEWVDSVSFSVHCPAFEHVVTVRAPSAVYPKTIGSVNVLDVSPQGQLIVVGGDNGQLNLLDTNRFELRRELKGHSGDITTARFFPSGQVVLSGATDFQLRIFSTLDGSCAAVLKGHTGGILDTAIIDRGRNIVSSSRDGEVKLWDCASGSVIHTLVKLRAPVNKIALQTAGEGILPALDREIDHREVGTPGTILITASDDGNLRGFDVGNIKELFVRKPCPTGAAVLSCALDPTGSFAAAGTNTGVVEIVDLRCPDRPFVKFRHGEAAVNDIIFVTRNEILLAFGDGLSARVTFDNDKTAKLLTEFTGPDLDPLYAARIAPAGTGNRTSVWTAGRDGALRRY